MRRIDSIVLASIPLLIAPAGADDELCRTVHMELAPSAGLQLVAWIEDAAGNYVDTVYITQTTGLRGLGNRPGVMDTRSGPKWPYGARLSVLPVWAHRHGLEFPAVIWQQGSQQPDSAPTSSDLTINVAFHESSKEPYYNRPMQRSEPQWDAGTAPSVHVFTDKGELSSVATRRYPPRADLTPQPGDSPMVDGFAALNPFDAVSQATPLPGLFELAWQVPLDLPAGDYVLRIEAAKEFDFNPAYDEARYPPPLMPWSEYGLPYRGQPSVVYDVPFALRESATRAIGTTYTGYGDPDGASGTVFAPDGTISEDTPGSGALRLAMTPEGYRVRVSTAIVVDPEPPASPQLIDIAVAPSVARVTFIAPGDDGDRGTARSYEVRYRIGSTMSDAEFASATPHPESVTPVAGAHQQQLDLDGLAPRTPYVVGIRAIDDCGRRGPLMIAAFVTERGEGEVGGCGGCASTEPGIALILLALLRRRRRRLGPRSS